MQKNHSKEELNLLLDRLSAIGVSAQPITEDGETVVDVAHDDPRTAGEIEAMAGVREVVRVKDGRFNTDDVRVLEIKELLSPDELISDLPITEEAARNVYDTRQAIHRVLHGADDRLLVIIGPCSIHDVAAGVSTLRNRARRSAGRA
jgi:hypothetical protein